MNDNKHPDHLFSLGETCMTTTAIEAIREIVESFSDEDMAIVLGDERIRDLKGRPLRQLRKVARRAIYIDLILRHVTGEWSELSEDDRQANEHAVDHDDERIFSVYVVYGVRFYVITDAHRVRTTVMLSTDY